MYVSLTGGKSEYSNFYIIYRGKFLLCIKYFLNKDEEFRYFRLRFAYSLIHNEFLGTSSDKDNYEGLRNKRKVHNLEIDFSHAKKCRGLNWYCG